MCDAEAYIRMLMCRPLGCRLPSLRSARRCRNSRSLSGSSRRRAMRSSRALTSSPLRCRTRVAAMCRSSWRSVTWPARSTAYSPPHRVLDKHESVRGSQYCSDAYQTRLGELGFLASMSGKGNCYDNAVVETFFNHQVRTDLEDCVHVKKPS